LATTNLTIEEKLELLKRIGRCISDTGRMGKKTSYPY